MNIVVNDDDPYGLQDTSLNITLIPFIMTLTHSYRYCSFWIQNGFYSFKTLLHNFKKNLYLYTLITFPHIRCEISYILIRYSNYTNTMSRCNFNSYIHHES